MSDAQTAEQKKKWRDAGFARVKAAVLSAYGNKCACCGETEVKFLTIDHVNGDGFIDRKAGMGGRGLWAKVFRAGCPSLYRILCMNCNHAMGIWGLCPHGNLPPQKTNHPANPY